MIVYARVNNPERFSLYVEAVGPCITSHGGRLIGRGNPALVLEGNFDWQTVGLLEFPSMDMARRFWFSPEYLRIKALRDGAADFQVVLIEPPP
jgi:uncharacterized protein (DUF1330 family)